MRPRLPRRSAPARRPRLTRSPCACADRAVLIVREARLCSVVMSGGRRSTFEPACRKSISQSRTRFRAMRISQFSVSSLATRGSVRERRTSERGRVGERAQVGARRAAPSPSPSSLAHTQRAMASTRPAQPRRKTLIGGAAVPTRSTMEDACVDVPLLPPPPSRRSTSRLTPLGAAQRIQEDAVLTLLHPPPRSYEAGDCIGTGSFGCALLPRLVVAQPRLVPCELTLPRGPLQDHP